MKQSIFETHIPTLDELQELWDLDNDSDEIKRILTVNNFDDMDFS
jgi:hypothetical protein